MRRRGLVVRTARTVVACLGVATVTACGADAAPTPGDSSPPGSTLPDPPTDVPSTADTGSPSSPSSPSGPTDPPTTTAAVPGRPPFAFTTERVTAEQLGASWRPGCPVGPEDLSLLRLTYTTPDGGTSTGELVVATSAAAEVAAAFGDLYTAHFPITRMTTIDAYGADDDLSMADDNTSAFNCRPVTGGQGWSRHSYGLAIDINPLVNPYVIDDLVLPPAGQAYLDRSDVRPGMIVAGDVVVDAFSSRGFRWGGDFETVKDYQHFDR